MTRPAYRQHTSGPVRRLVADLIALGDGWRGTAPPLRMIGWALASVLATAVLVIAAHAGVVPPDGLETLLRYVARW